MVSSNASSRLSPCGRHWILAGHPTDAARAAADTAVAGYTTGHPADAGSTRCRHSPTHRRGDHCWIRRARRLVSPLGPTSSRRPAASAPPTGAGRKGTERATEGERERECVAATSHPNGPPEIEREREKEERAVKERIRKREMRSG